VVVGNHRRDEETEGKKTIAVTKNTWHPDYDATGNIENDVAVLVVGEDMTRMDQVQPICPPTKGDDGYAGDIAIVSGWGTTASGGR
jgi:hypothetical protein